MNNFFNAYKSRGIVFKISFTGIMLALVILFQFLEQFTPFFGTFVKLNFSLLFILPVFYFAGPQYGIMVLLGRFFIGPALSKYSYAPFENVAQFILLFCSVIVIITMYIFSSLFKKIKSHNLKVILISSLTVLTSSIILTVINGLFFTPLYFKTYR
jgi:riboflavin transporter FmnP